VDLLKLNEELAVRALGVPGEVQRHSEEIFHADGHESKRAARGKIIPFSIFAP
jgi:hypothetical protein